MKKATGSEAFSNEKSTALVHVKSNLFQQLAAFCATPCNQHCLLVINILQNKPFRSSLIAVYHFSFNLWLLIVSMKNLWRGNVERSEVLKSYFFPVTTMLTMHKDGLFSTFADAARPALHLRVHPAALPTQDNLLHWLATLPGPAAGFPRMQLRLRRLARFLVACTLCINSEKAWLVLLSVQRFCAVCKTFARLIMSVKYPFPLVFAGILANTGKMQRQDAHRVDHHYPSKNPCMSRIQLLGMFSQLFIISWSQSLPIAKYKSDQAPNRHILMAAGRKGNSTDNHVFLQTYEHA